VSTFISKKQILFPTIVDVDLFLIVTSKKLNYAFNRFAGPIKSITII